MSEAVTDRPTRLGLATLVAIVPLYATLAALDPERPPIPPLLPHAVAVALGLAALAAYLSVVAAGLRAAQPATVRFGFLAGGIATLAAAFPGFDPVTGTGLGVLVLGMGLGGLALSRADAATVRLCVRTFLWSALLAALVALAMLVARRPVAIYAYDNGRAVGTFLNPNELAAYCLVALGCALPLAIVTRGRDRLAVAASVALAVALGATFSRWGAVSAVCGLAAFAFALRARRWLVLALAVAVAALALDLTAGARHHNPRDTEARDVAWRTGWTTFTRFPLLGVGPLAYAKTYEVFRSPDAPGPRAPVAFDPHSLPLSFAASGGLVALVTLGASVVILQRRIYRDARTAPQVGRLVALGLASGLLALYVDCTINTISLFFPLGLQGVGFALAAAREGVLE
ncbi:MAG TPA: O-antigen ligase family protein [Candidatus Limnocylindria bacterium]|nr:O-antigen ligase family protein [Candidatus Limnocylindria bacterium]